MSAAKCHSIINDKGEIYIGVLVEVPTNNEFTHKIVYLTESGDAHNYMLRSQDLLDVKEALLIDDGREVQKILDGLFGWINESDLLFPLESYDADLCRQFNELRGGIKLALPDRKPAPKGFGAVVEGRTKTGIYNTNEYWRFVNVHRNDGKWYCQATAEFVDWDEIIDPVEVQDGPHEVCNVYRTEWPIGA